MEDRAVRIQKNIQIARDNLLEPTAKLLSGPEIEDQKVHMDFLRMAYPNGLDNSLEDVDEYTADLFLTKILGESGKHKRAAIMCLFAGLFHIVGTSDLVIQD